MINCKAPSRPAANLLDIPDQILTQLLQNRVRNPQVPPLLFAHRALNLGDIGEPHGKPMEIANKC